MDANGQRFWQLASGRDFPALDHALWDAGCGVLRLASERTLAPVLSAPDAFARAQEALERPARAVDSQECVAWWQDGVLWAASSLPGAVPLIELADAPGDLAVGFDGVLYVVTADGVRLHDLRGRWADVSVTLAGFTPWRLAPDPAGGVWVLERTTGRIARVSGQPLINPPDPDAYDGRVFRPCPENCHAPALTLVAAPAWGADERVLGLAWLAGTGLVLLSWRGADGAAHIRFWLADENRPSAPLALAGADYAYTLAGVGADRIAVRVPGRRDAPVFRADFAAAPASVLPLGEVYPLAADAVEAPFANGPLQPPYYPTGEHGCQPLFPLSIRHLARAGSAASHAADPASVQRIDSADATTVWHRLCVEADIPPHCGFTVWLAAGNEAAPPDPADLTRWQPHAFGRDIAALDPAVTAPQVPHAVWERAASEVPAHPGLLGGTRERDRRGLFTVLVQNARTRVRRLSGRFLWLRVDLYGNGQASPEIAALRVWGSRFDYADHYLPRLYRETLYGAEAAAPGVELARIDPAHVADLDAAGAVNGAVGDALRARLLAAQIVVDPAARVSVERAGQAWLVQSAGSAWRIARGAGALVVYRPEASAADFNARLLANFEGLLTQLEDRVAAAHLLTDPDAAPDTDLDWLGGWIGVAFDPVLPAARRRDWLRAAPALASRHGTRDGLRLALDIATDGGVRSGSLVVIEDFRLRRILATLLGVDLGDQRDPLLPGLGVSGNSVVGDTLFLGDRERAELLALYRADAASDAENDALAEDFYGRLANRATVLVHNQVSAQDFALIRRVVQLEAPAHVEVQVVAASWPLLVGIASLVGVDTWLGPPRQPRPVRVQESALGVGDYLVDTPLLDPRLAGTTAATAFQPLAKAGAGNGVGPGGDVAWGDSFELDGSGSHAAPGLSIAEYRWRLLPPDA